MAEKSKTLFPKPIPCRTEVRFRVFRGETNLTEFVRTPRLSGDLQDTATNIDSRICTKV